MPPASPQTPVPDRQVVTFSVDGRLFGVPVGTVREIRAMQAITPVAGAPSYVVGVINLRGRLVPVHEMRARLGCGPAAADAVQVILVIESASRTVGLLADAVCDIVDITGDEVRAVGDVIQDGDMLVAELAIKGDDIVSLLDIGQLGDSGAATLSTASAA